MVVCRTESCQRNKDIMANGYCATCIKAASEISGGGNTAQGASANPPPAPDITNFSSFPPNLVNAAAGCDPSKLSVMMDKVIRGETVDQGEMMKGMFSMVFGVYQSVGSMEQVKSDLVEVKNDIQALKEKVGDTDEPAVSLSLAIQNLIAPPPGYTDRDMVIGVLREVKAPGLDPNVDVVKVKRKGFRAEASGNSKASLGTVLVQLRNQEVRAKIMKNKNCLLNHQDEKLRNLKIRNMKTQSEMNQDFTNRQLLKMLPGGDKWYIAGNGSLRPQTRPNHQQGALPHPGGHQGQQVYHNQHQQQQHQQPGAGPGVQAGHQLYNFYQQPPLVHQAPPPGFAPGPRFGTPVGQSADRFPAPPPVTSGTTSITSPTFPAQ